MSDSNETRLEGQVKWFNNQLNYGFITVISEGQHNGVDVFVHQTSIIPTVSNYRTLTQGEYVSFVFSENTNERHPYHATEIKGIKGGKLMCDFYNPNMRRNNHNNRRDNGHSRNNYNNNSSNNSSNKTE